MLPNLLGGRLLTGVLPPEQPQVPVHPWLPSHTPILDIEACIDDPSLAPLGTHIRGLPSTTPSVSEGNSSSRSSSVSSKSRKKRRERSNNDKTGRPTQVEIQRKQDLVHDTQPSQGVLMLRRRNLSTQDLADQLHKMIPFAPLLQPGGGVALSDHRFDHLVELDVSRNRLTDLPVEVSMLSRLRVLNASSNQLTDVPVSLFRHLARLEVLNLSQNQVQTIPDELPALLPRLVTLSLAGNRIDYLTPNMDRWRRLRHLQLGSVYGGNHLTWVPESLAHMPRLEELDLSNNLLARLPTNMAMPTLLHLNVSKNQLEAVPSSVGQCRRLRTLNVSKNHLTTLPVDLVHLSSLELLDMSENLLCIVPADLLECMKTTLLITGNPVTRPGHCGDPQHHPADAYGQILQQMSMRALPSRFNNNGNSSNNHYSAPASPHIPATPPQHHQFGFLDACGPQGKGCLASQYPSPYPSPSTSASRDNPLGQDADSDPIASPLVSPPASPLSSPARLQHQPQPLALQRHHSHHLRRHAPSPLHDLLSDDDDDGDARIDRELSMLAQQLNVNGSRRGVVVGSPPSSLSNSPAPSLLLPTAMQPTTSTSSSTSLSMESRATSPWPLREMEGIVMSRSLLMEEHVKDMEDEMLAAAAAAARGGGDATPLQDDMDVVCAVVGKDAAEPPAVTNILHSLRELATRVILQHDVRVPLHMIPPHLANDLTAPHRYCTKCALPFVNEWLTSVQVKSYRGHPAVVRRVRFCSTRCWHDYLQSRSSSMVCVHRPETQSILRASADQEEDEWRQASMSASSSSTTNNSTF